MARPRWRETRQVLEPTVAVPVSLLVIDELAWRGNRGREADPTATVPSEAEARERGRSVSPPVGPLPWRGVCNVYFQPTTLASPYPQHHTN